MRFIRYQSRMIDCADVVTIEEAREINESLDTDQDRAEDERPRRASRARKRPHTDDFPMTTEKTTSDSSVVFPKHYLHFLEKVDAIVICFNFCYEILSQSQKYHRNNDQIYLQHCRPSISYFVSQSVILVLFRLVNSGVYAKNKR